MYNQILSFVTCVMIKRRGAFDIGSGATKLQVSDVASGGVLLKTLFGEERPCAFGADWLRSTDGCLSVAIQEKGIKIIENLKLIGDELGVESYAVIATEVFRKAVNGHLFLDKVRSMGMTVTVVSQEMEAELGYATAVAYNDPGSQACIAWDSGGGSFQISTKCRDDRTCSEGVSATASDSIKLDMYMASFGSGVATATLVETLQGRKLSEVSTPNPVSIADADRLIDALMSRLDSNVPSWLLNVPEVVAIGGPNSIFQLACTVLNAMKKSSKNRNFTDTSEVCSFTLADVRSAIEECVDRSDEYLQKYLAFPNADPVTIVVPKLCLLYSVMKLTRIGKVKAVNCIGSCAGILITDRFYTPE